MSETIIDALARRGWGAHDFNHTGDRPPYCRIDLSWVKRVGVFSSASFAKRTLMPWASIPIVQLLEGCALRVDRELYDDFEGHHLRARWISDQELFPFGEWVWPVRFKPLGMIVRPTSAGRDHETFLVEYGALSVGGAFELQRR